MHPFLRLAACAFLLLLVPGCSSEASGWPTPAKSPAIEEARALLTEAGYPFGNGFPEVELLYNTNEGHKKIAAAVQEMWRQNLGIDITLRNTEWKVYLDALSNLDYQVARRGWIADYPDPNTFIDMFKTGGGHNNTGWSNAEYDRLVEEAAVTADKQERLAKLRRAEEILMEELPILPIYFYVSQAMWNPAVKGLYENALNVHPLKQVVKGDGTGQFILNAGAEPHTLDPNIQRGQPEHRINIALFEGLTSYHPETLEPQPGVAERWETSEGGKRWTFTLRECKWSNGRTLTAHDFVYGWRRHINPEIASDYAYIIHDYLANAKEYHNGASADLTLKGFGTLDDAKRWESAEKLVEQVQARHAEALRKAVEAEKIPEIRNLLEKALKSAPGRKDVRIEDVGVRAQDDKTLVVDLIAPMPYFLYLTSFFSYYPIPREAIEEHGEKWFQLGKMVNNGPFRLKEWVAKSHIIVEKNPHYWDAANVKQKEIKFLPIDNVNTAYNMFRSGQCDYIDTVPLEFVDALKKDPNFHSEPIQVTYFYSCNVTKPPLDNPRVRRALALAIEREIIVEKILRGGQKPAYSIVPPSLTGYEPPPFYGKPAPN